MIISVGIDPGKSGAVVALAPGPKLYRWFDQPTVNETKTRKGLDPHGAFRELEALDLAAIQEGDELRAILEFGGVMPREGNTSCMKTGMAIMQWWAFLVALDIPYKLVRPQVWTKIALKGITGEGKDRAKIRATREVPALELYGPRGGYKDGRGDACCLALYGQEVWT